MSSRSSSNVRDTRSVLEPSPVPNASARSRHRRDPRAGAASDPASASSAGWPRRPSNVLCESGRTSLRGAHCVHQLSGFRRGRCFAEIERMISLRRIFEGNRFARAMAAATSASTSGRASCGACAFTCAPSSIRASLVRCCCLTAKTCEQPFPRFDDVIGVRKFFAIAVPPCDPD